MASIKIVVLVHGGFVDGAGWGSVYKILKNGGYRVSIVQNPTISLQDDAAATQRILATQDGPAILVGHSYGGAVITEAGTHPKVAALVYITAFAPDKGESVATLIKDPPPGAPVPPILPPQDGYLFLDKAKFRASFAADVDPETAAFMADSQVPWGLGALSGAISEPAWRIKPSWYLVVTEDQMIPAVAQRALDKAGKVLRIPTVVTTTARDSMWGPTFPELVEVVGGEHIIDRSSVNAWDDPKVAAAIEATGRKKLIFAGISLEVCAAFPAITALGKGYDAYVAVDASGTFSETKRHAGLLRMQQAGVILSDYATLMVEILKDNASPLAGPVYGALDMPWATLVGQIAEASVK